MVEFQIHLGDVIYKLRKAREWRQEDLAKKAGLNKETINKIESGKTNFESDTLKKIATALASTPDELYAILHRWKRADSEDGVRRQAAGAAASRHFRDDNS